MKKFNNTESNESKNSTKNEINRLANKQINNGFSFKSIDRKSVLKRRSNLGGVK